jgi:hypothetical protein
LASSNAQTSCTCLSSAGQSSATFPTLRSRGKPVRDAQELARHPAFAREMTALFEGEPSGTFLVSSFAALFARLVALEARVHALARGVVVTAARHPATDHPGDG